MSALTTRREPTTKEKIRKRALLDRLLADVSNNPAKYVQRYDVRRGGE